MWLGLLKFQHVMHCLVWCLVAYNAPCLPWHYVWNEACDFELGDAVHC